MELGRLILKLMFDGPRVLWLLSIWCLGVCGQHGFQIRRPRICVRIGRIVKGDCEEMMSQASPRFQLVTVFTLLWNIHPYCFFIEGVFVGIEATKGRVAL